MDYLGIIKKAYEISIKHKFLWIFGILAGGLGGRFRGLNPNFANYTTNSTDWTNKLPYTSLASFWQIWGALIITCFLICAGLAIILFIFKIISQGGLIGSVDRIAGGKKSNFHDGFKIGVHHFWRILGVFALYILMILASLVVLAGPTIFLVVFGQVVLAIVWGILLFFVCLVFWILVGLILPYSLRMVVLENEGVWESIRGSLHFFRDYWKEISIMYLLLLAISIGFGIAYMLAILIVGGILLAIGFGMFLASPLVAVVYGVTIGLLFLTGLVVVAGVYNTFYSTSLTLTYNTLVKKAT